VRNLSRIIVVLSILFSQSGRMSGAPCAPGFRCSKFVYTGVKSESTQDWIFWYFQDWAGFVANPNDDHAIVIRAASFHRGAWASYFRDRILKEAVRAA